MFKVIDNLSKKHIYITYTLLFLLVAGIGFLPIWTCGSSLIHRVDGIGQYYPAFLYIGQWQREFLSNLLNGSFSVRLYDLSIGLGEDVVGSLNYYGFGDPLNLLAVFANTGNGSYVFMFSFFLRLYLSGLTFLIFSSYFKLDPVPSVLGAVGYALAGYGICSGTKYLEFLCPLIYFPLMILGLEKIIRGEKSHMLELSVFYAGLCSFYFLYIASLGLLGYGIMRLVFLKKEHPFKTTFCAVIHYLIGCLLSSPILLPAAAAFLSSSRSDLSVLSIIANIENWIPHPGRIMMFFTSVIPDTSTLYWTGIPVFYVCLPFISAYYCFILKNKLWKQCTLAAWIGILAWCTPIFSYAASAFGQYYSRWIFIMMFAYSVIFIFVWTETEKHISQTMIRTAFSIFLVNIIACIYLLFSPSGKNYVSYMIPHSIVSQYTSSPVAESSVLSEDHSFYRIETDPLTGVNGRPENVAMLNGYYGNTYWLSVVNNATQCLIDQTGQNILGYRSYGFNDLPIYEAFSSSKYIFKRADKVSDDKKPLETVIFNNQQWNMYENPDYLPFAVAFEKQADYNLYQNSNILDRMIISSRYACSDSLAPAAYAEYESAEYLKIPVVTENEKEFTISIEQTDPEKNTLLWINGEILVSEKKIEKLMIDDSEYILQNHELLYQCTSSKISLTIPSAVRKDYDEHPETYFRLYSLDSNQITSDLQSHIVKDLNVIYHENQFTCDYSLDSDGILQLSVQFNKNWSAYLDGQQIDISQCNTGFIAFSSPSGDHSLQLVYRPKANILGLAAAVIGIILLKFSSRFNIN